MIEEQIEGCSISYEKVEMAPSDVVIKKKGIEIKGKTLQECRKHFNEIWNAK